MRTEVFSLKYAVCRISDHTHSLISRFKHSCAYTAVSMVESSHTAHRGGGDAVRELKIPRVRVGSSGLVGQDAVPSIE